MAKVDAEALNKLLTMVNEGQLIQIEQTPFCYEVTVWPSRHDRLNHHHYQGDTLIEAILKIKNGLDQVSTG
jgi:hypothetical protein